jgi:hypothetical protein
MSSSSGSVGPSFRLDASYDLRIPDSKGVKDYHTGVRLEAEWFQNVYKPPKLKASNDQIVDRALEWLSKVPGWRMNSDDARAELSRLLDGAEERRIQFLALNDKGEVGKAGFMGRSERAFTEKVLREHKSEGGSGITYLELVAKTAQDAADAAFNGFELSFKRPEMRSETPYLDAIEVLSQTSKTIASNRRQGLTDDELMKFALNAAGIELRAEQSFARGKNTRGLLELLAFPEKFPNPTLQARARDLRGVKEGPEKAAALSLCLLGPEGSFSKAVEEHFSFAHQAAQKVRNLAEGGAKVFEHAKGLGEVRGAIRDRDSSNRERR